MSSSGPESSGLHLEVAASLGDISFEQEVRAGPFLVDLLINGKTEQKRGKSAADVGEGDCDAACSRGGEVNITAPVALIRTEKMQNTGNSHSSVTVPRLHTRGPVTRPPWDSRRRADREIFFAVEGNSSFG